MKIQIYGTGCTNCRRLEANAREAVSELGLSADIEKVDDINAMIQAGILRTPGFAIDGELISQGRLWRVEEIKKILSEKVK